MQSRWNFAIQSAPFDSLRVKISFNWPALLLGLVLKIYSDLTQVTPAVVRKPQNIQPRIEKGSQLLFCFPGRPDGVQSSEFPYIYIYMFIDWTLLACDSLAPHGMVFGCQASAVLPFCNSDLGSRCAQFSAFMSVYVWTYLECTVGSAWLTIRIQPFVWFSRPIFLWSQHLRILFQGMGVASRSVICALSLLVPQTVWNVGALQVLGKANVKLWT